MTDCHGVFETKMNISFTELSSDTIVLVQRSLSPSERRAQISLVTKWPQQSVERRKREHGSTKYKTSCGEETVSPVEEIEQQISNVRTLSWLMINTKVKMSFVCCGQTSLYLFGLIFIVREEKKMCLGWP